MKRAARRPLQTVPAAVLLFLGLLALPPESSAAAPGKGGSGAREPVRLEEMLIRGDKEYPGVLYRLPRPEVPVFPFTTGPDERKESLLRDTRDDDASGTDGAR